jgi:hypothetical protein
MEVDFHPILGLILGPILGRLWADFGHNLEPILLGAAGAVGSHGPRRAKHHKVDIGTELLSLFEVGRK